MPEGDTVWRTARRLDEALSGRRLTRTDFRVPELATIDLAGLPVVETLARGKHLLTRVGDDLSLHTHLKMEGSWHLYHPGTAWRRPAHEARIILTADNWVAVGFALGVVELVARAEESRVVGHLGPDLLGPDWDPPVAESRLLREPGRPVATVLLDQGNLAGIGNLYKSELCFLAGVHPETAVRDVPDLSALVRRAASLLHANKERVAQTTTGDLRAGRRVWVYRRDRQPCRRCGTTIRVSADADPTRARATYWCPSCQAAS